MVPRDAVERVGKELLVEARVPMLRDLAEAAWNVNAAAWLRNGAPL